MEMGKEHEREREQDGNDEGTVLRCFALRGEKGSSCLFDPSSHLVAWQQCVPECSCVPVARQPELQSQSRQGHIVVIIIRDRGIQRH
ncbi:uncharacterized [Tachysurus ichikawai]